MEPDDWRPTLERIMDETAAPEERVLLRDNLLAGRIIFISARGDDPKSIAVGGTRGQIQLEIGEQAQSVIKESLFPAPPGIAPPFPSLVFIGRENELEEVRGRLGLTPDSASKSPVTVVRGWPGVGKTSLVGVIGRDPGIVNEFPDGVLWTSLNQEPNLIAELAKWGRALGSEDVLREPTINTAAERVGGLLQNKRMLLIVDDVWKEAHAAPFLQARGPGCALLITTRLNSVADAIAPQPEMIYKLPVLTEENSLKLLNILAPSVVDDYPNECRDLVQSLENLPLALNVAGRLLRSEERLGFGVVDLLNDIRQGARQMTLEAAPVDRAEGGSIPTVSALLDKSTALLDPETRKCFALLGPFVPKPATFDLQAMKAMWRIEDDAVKRTARKLVNYGLLEPVGSGRFQMHALLIQHARSLLEG